MGQANTVKIKGHAVVLPDWVMKLLEGRFTCTALGYWYADHNGASISVNGDELDTMVGYLEYRLRELVHETHRHIAVVWVIDAWLIMSYTAHPVYHSFRPHSKYQFLHFETALEAWIDIAETEGVDEEVRRGGMINKYEETAEDQPVVEQGAKEAQSA